MCAAKPSSRPMCWTASLASSSFAKRLRSQSRRASSTDATTIDSPVAVPSARRSASMPGRITSWPRSRGTSGRMCCRVRLSSPNLLLMAADKESAVPGSSSGATFRFLGDREPGGELEPDPRPSWSRRYDECRPLPRYRSAGLISLPSRLMHERTAAIARGTKPFASPAPQQRKRVLVMISSANTTRTSSASRSKAARPLQDTVGSRS